ncbi:hypothetical protein PG984_000096 [Apiospora sp. TS-2023a]
MRLDRPRQKPVFWSVEKGKYQNGPHWDPDEMRALAGAYYLSSRYLAPHHIHFLLDITEVMLTYHSSSSVLMQKSKHFQYTSYMHDYCEHLGQQAQYPTDEHLSYIVRLQKLIEDVDSMMTSADSKSPVEMERIKEECSDIRVSLPFPLHESPPITMQLSLLELLLSQSSLGGSTFGIDKIHEIQNMNDSQLHLLEWLSTSIAAVRSLINMVLLLPAGEERPVSNTIWLALYCAMALGVRLDLLAAHKGPSGPAYHLRRFLDMPNTLRQIFKRSESASGDEVDETGDRDVFHHMANRSRRLEEWYLERIQMQGRSQLPIPTSGPETRGCREGDAIQAASESDPHLSTIFATGIHASGAPEPPAEGLLDNSLFYDADIAFGNVLFGDTGAYAVDFERWTTFE